VGLIWRGYRRKPLRFKKNLAAQLRLAKLHLNTTDETKVEMFGPKAKHRDW